MKKSFVFIMVGLVYIVIAMAASWADSSKALDKSLEVIGITPGTDASHSQNTIDIQSNGTDDFKQTDVEYNIVRNNMLAYYIPVPPPGSGTGTRPKEIIA